MGRLLQFQVKIIVRDNEDTKEKDRYHVYRERVTERERDSKIGE